jgi:hypothetical protein
MRLPTRCTRSFAAASWLIGVFVFICSKLVSPSCLSSPDDTRLNCRRPVTGAVEQAWSHSMAAQSAAINPPTRVPQFFMMNSLSLHNQAQHREISTTIAL